MTIQGSCMPKFPKTCDFALLLRTKKSLIWRMWYGWQREVLLQNLPHFSAGFCSLSWALLSCSDWTCCSLFWAGWTFSSTPDCAQTWQAPSDWGFCSITWHGAVSCCVLLAKKHCAACVCDFDHNALFLSSAFCLTLRQILLWVCFENVACKGWVVRAALQGPGPAPFL